MPRMNLQKSHKMAYAAVLGLEGYTRIRMPARLNELVKLRASLLNGCGYCIAMHTKALEKAGESQERMDALEGEVPSSLFDERELAALALTDAVTRLEMGGVPDDVWDEAARVFSEAELGDLVVAIATINVWNRMGIATKLDA